MNVLIVTGSYPPMKCGVGDYSFRLASVLSNLPGMRVAVVTSGSNAEEFDLVDGVEIHRKMKGWELREWRTLVKVIRQFAPDLVHVQYPTQGYANGWLPSFIPVISASLGIEVVQTWHEGCSIRKLPDLFLKAIVPGGLVVVRPNYRQTLSPLLRWSLWNKAFRFIRNASAVPRAEIDGDERARLRAKFLHGQERLIVFFGFVLPHKGAELLFDIAEPKTDHIVIAGELGAGEMNQRIRSRQSEDLWQGKSTVTGFLPIAEMAALLAVADAVVLPFRTGGGDWNSSIHGAMMQGTFVLTTSKTTNGYDGEKNVYFARIDDVGEMKAALGAHSGTIKNTECAANEWETIAHEHELFYQSLLAK